MDTPRGWTRGGGGVTSTHGQSEGTFARRTRHPNECSGHLSQCFTPKHHSLLQPGNPKHKHLVSLLAINQIPIFSPNKWDDHMHPTLVGPIMATHLKIKEPPSCGVTDHSSDTEEWESLTPTRGATPKPWTKGSPNADFCRTDIPERGVVASCLRCHQILEEDQRKMSAGSRWFLFFGGGFRPR